jgi:acetylornithine deacetylase/succinyl-diaminopimelate desuccinylase-like protein
MSANARITALASDRQVHAAFAWLHLHQPQLRRWQLEFLAIPAPPFGESARAAWFLKKFTELGLSNPHLDDAGNALAELGDPGPSAPSEHGYPEAPALPQLGYPEPLGSGLIAAEKDRGFSPRGMLSDAPCILLSAHLDTVFPPSTDCTPREDGPMIHGPGACDNGAGLTALLALAAALKHSKILPSTTILFCANVGEEGPGDLRGMRHIFQTGPYKDRIRAAIALEGSGTASVVDRALGSRRLRVTVNGPGGHSWADAGRPNPILELASALHAIGKLKLHSKPRTTLNIGTISGGTSVNSIPESATCELDIRSTSSLELDRLELNVLNTFTDKLNLKFDISRIGNRPSGALAPSSALATSLRAVDRHLGLTTESRIGSTDANLPLSLNIPALAIGGGGTGSGIHTLQESYDPTGRDLAHRRILLLLLDIASQDTFSTAPS